MRGVYVRPHMRVVHAQGRMNRRVVRSSGQEGGGDGDDDDDDDDDAGETTFDADRLVVHVQLRRHSDDGSSSGKEEESDSDDVDDLIIGSARRGGKAAFDVDGNCRFCGVHVSPHRRGLHVRGRMHRDNVISSGTVVVSHPSAASVTPDGRVSVNVDVGTRIHNVVITDSRLEHPDRGGQPGVNYLRMCHVTHVVSSGPVVGPGKPTFVTLNFHARQVLGTFSPTLCLDFDDFWGNHFTVRRRWNVTVKWKAQKNHRGGVLRHEAAEEALNDEGLDPTSPRYHLPTRRPTDRLGGDGVRRDEEGLEAIRATSPYCRPPRRSAAATAAAAADALNHHDVEPGQSLEHGGKILNIYIPNPHNAFLPSGEVRAGLKAAPGSLVSRVLEERLAMAPTRHNYAAAFGALLMAEEIQNHINIRDYDIEPASMFPRRRSGSGDFLTLRVPGLAENRPSVRRGSKIIAVDGCNNRYEGVVHGIEHECVLLKFSERLMTRWLVSPSTTSAVTFARAQFTFNRTQTILQHMGLRRAVSEGYMSYLYPPTVPDVPRSVGCYLPPLAVPPFNAALNEEQINAVRASMRRGSRAPYVIFGPPGTGKTSAVVELIKQIMSSYSRLGNHVRILMTAPSNAAVDNVVERLLKGGGGLVPREQVLRVNSLSRSKESVLSREVLDVCLWNDLGGHFGVPSREQMRNANVVAMTCMTAARYACCENLSGGFDYVIIDEAGQATEPEAVSSIAGMMRKDGSLIIAGDHKQLGPIVESPLAKVRLGVSLLERLCSPGGPHGPSPNGEFDADYTTMLVRNYRSHPAIIEVPSRSFYDDRLVPKADPDRVRSLLSWEGLANPGPEADFPVLFHGVVGRDQREGNSPSWFNTEEALAVARHIKSLQQLPRWCGFSLDQVSVITPYHKQKLKLCTLLCARGMEAVRVGTTEEFQGGEKRVIIISLTRSSPKHAAKEARYHLGFVSNPQRFNVAVTRAQALLIIVGNPLLMAKDKYWGELLRQCVDRGGYRGVQLPDDLFADNKEEQKAEEAAAAAAVKAAPAPAPAPAASSSSEDADDASAAAAEK